MSKDLETIECLEKIIDKARINAGSCCHWRECLSKNKCILYNSDSMCDDYIRANTIKQALLELKKIKESNPTEALKCLKELKDIVGVFGDSSHLIEPIKQALQRLESIENAKSSEALECLEIIKSQNCCEDNSIGTIYYDECNTIKQSLIKAQEDKIIADFIREHYKLSNDINKNYLELKKPITEEEHIKFKENL